MPKNKIPSLHEPVHHWFGLSYASYAVLPRTILQSMPEKWQKQFVKLMDEAEEKITHPKSGQYYTVYLRDKKGRFIADPMKDYQRGRLKLKLKT